MTGIIIYRADEQDDWPSPLLTSANRSQTTIVFSPPSLLKTFLQRRKIFFTPSSKHCSYMYYVLAKLLGLHYGRTAEVRELLRAAPEQGALVLVANDYLCAELYATHLKRLGCPVSMHCLTRSRHLLPYIALMWLLARSGLLRGRPRPELSILHINPYSRWMPDILLSLFPQARLMMRWHDPAVNGDETAIARQASRYRSRGVTFESYSKTDARNLGIEYMPNFADAGFLRELAETASITAPCALFVGAAGHHGQGRRMRMLLRLAQILEEHGVNYEFYICGQAAPLPELRQSAALPRSLHLNYPRLSYNRYLSMVAACTCLVDLCHVSGDEGYSYRVAEAVLMGKKLLTDRTALTSEPFYTAANILIIEGFEDPDLGGRIADFLRQDTVPYEHTECLTLQAWAKHHSLPCAGT